MKYYFLFILSFIISLASYSQPVIVKEYPFYQQYSGVNTWTVFAFDDGYALGGVIEDYDKDMYGVFLIRTDLSGDTLWTKALFFGSPQAYSPNIKLKMITDHEGNYFFTYNDVLVKVSSTGDSLWAKKYGNQRIEAITLTQDERILLGTIGSAQCKLFIINTAGDILGQRLVTTSPGTSFTCSITEMKNGNFAYVTLYEEEFFTNFHGAFIYLLNAAGDLISRSDSWFSTDNLHFLPMIANGDDELMFTGGSFMYDYPSFYAKLKTDGSLGWINAIYGSVEVFCSPVVRNTDSTFAVVWSREDYYWPHHNCIWRLFVFDDAGTIHWEDKHINSTSGFYTFIRAVACRSKSGFILGGMSITPTHSDPMLMVIDTTEANGIPTGLNSEMQVYPNPAIDRVTIGKISFGKGKLRLEISSLVGIKMDEMNVDDEKFTFSVSNYKNGMYLVRLYDGDRLVGQQKLIKQ